MTRRNTTDPLVRAFLQTYKINLLSVPRANADVGDAYVVSGHEISTPGQLRYLLTPEFVMPQVARDEKLSDIAGKQTRALDLNVGIKLLEGFLSAVGVEIGIDNIKAEYEYKRTRRLRFQLKTATRDSVDAFEFGRALIPCQLNSKQPFVSDGNRYYVSVGVLRSSSITVYAEDQSSNKTIADASAIGSAIGARGKLGVKQERGGELTYRGRGPLAFGVELVEMAYDKLRGKFLLTAVPDAQEIRAPKIIERVFIGDPITGNVFIDVG